MPRHAAAAFAAVICLALPVGPASANQTLDAVTRNYTDAAVQLRDCRAMLTDTEYGNVDYYVHPAVTIMNLGHKDVIAVKVQFRTLNSFDEKLDEYIGLSDHRVQPDYEYEQEWDFLNFDKTAKKVVCEIYAVRFSDGTTWTNSFKYPAKSAPAPNRATPKPEPRPTPAPHRATPKPAPKPTPKPTPKPRATAAPVSSEHPATCRVKLADGSEIEIPWDNPGCADARRAAGNASPAPVAPGSGKAGYGTVAAATGPGAGVVTYDRGDNSVQGHPATCTLTQGDSVRMPLWSSDACGPARAQWALEPAYMHEVLWDSHDAAPENLVSGHPRYCTPRDNKNDHYFWASVPCKNARLKWEAIRNNTPAPPG